MKILSPEILAGELTRTQDHRPRSDPSLQKIDWTLGWRPKSGGGWDRTRRRRRRSPRCF